MAFPGGIYGDTPSRRIRKVTPEKETEYIYDSLGQMIAEYEWVDNCNTTEWNVTKEYIWAEGRLVGVLTFDYATLTTGCSVASGQNLYCSKYYKVFSMALILLPGLGLILLRKRGNGLNRLVMVLIACCGLASMAPSCCTGFAINDYYVVTGHLGEPLKAFDVAQNLEWETWYTPFGKTVNQSQGEPGFRGQYIEIDTPSFSDIIRIWHESQE